MTRLFVPVLIASLVLSPVAYAAPTSQPAVPGDVAKNLHVLPPWTLRLCDKVMYATYDRQGALLLKGRDNDCSLWKARSDALEQTEAAHLRFEAMWNKVRASFEKELSLYKVTVKSLRSRLKKEITEKNKYKYKPSYSWIYLSVGAAVAVIGVAFGVGVWVARK